MADTDVTALFDGQLAIQAPLSTDDLAKIPAKRGVFFLAGPDRTPLLLATGANIRSRMRFRLTAPAGRSRRADLGQVARWLLWKLTHSHFETDWQFLELARAIYPDRYQKMLSFKRACFVHVDAAGPCPCFRTGREVFSAAGRYFGPFPDTRAAKRFVGILQDVFDLCRHEEILRRAPQGRPCVYAQMGRCRPPCDGSISIDAYRRVVLDACRCAEGDRRGAAESLTARMNRLAQAQRFEAAAICKGRLDSLAELDSPAFAHVAGAEKFQYILVQRGGARGKAKTFLADRGFIRPGASLTYPPQKRQLVALLSGMRKLTRADRPVGPAQRDRIGLLAQYLFSSDQRRGLIVRYTQGLTAERLAQAVCSAAGALRLAPPAAKARPPRP